MLDSISGLDERDAVDIFQVSLQFLMGFISFFFFFFLVILNVIQTD